ncbi:MAG: hypothetical protein PHG85_02195 [Candidatus Altiarchaeota archaeon]|nr:hypothetical protein [Candidatus Altiarchaeota archaeon]
MGFKSEGLRFGELPFPAELAGKEPSVLVGLAGRRSRSLRDGGAVMSSVSLAGAGVYAALRAYSHFADPKRCERYVADVGKGVRSPLDLPAYGQSVVACGNRCIAMVAAKHLGRYVPEDEVYRSARVGLGVEQQRMVEDSSRESSRFGRLGVSLPVVRLGLFNPAEDRIAMERLGLGYEETRDGDVSWLRKKLSEGKNPVVSLDGASLLPFVGRVSSLTSHRFSPHAIVVTKVDDTHVCYNDSGFTIGLKRKALHEDFMAAWKTSPIKGRYAFCDTAPYRSMSS